MAIQSIETGAWTPQAPPEPQHELLWLQGSPDVDEAVGVTLEMLTRLGGINDDNREAAEEEVRDNFTRLASLGYDGRLRVVPSPQNMSTEALISFAEGMRPESVEEIWRWKNLWIPGAEADSYTEADINGAQVGAIAQLAIFSSMTTDYDRSLHHLGLPYDQYAKDRWDPKADTTQLEAFADDRAEAEKRFDGFELAMTDHRAYLVDAIMARIQGVDPRSAEFPLNRGFMRLPAELGRRVVDGRSVVGVVDSAGGQLRFDWSDGSAGGVVGVGLSMGQKTA